MKPYIDCAAVLFSIIAAALWLFASLARVKLEVPTLGKVNNGIGFFEGKWGDYNNATDVLLTIRKQSFWNRGAAFAAAIAALCQGLSLISPNPG